MKIFNTCLLILLSGDQELFRGYPTQTRFDIGI